MSNLYSAELHELYGELKDVRKILIVTHVNPDGDATGSSLALSRILKGMGKDVTLYCRDPFPFNFTFLKGSSGVVHHIPEEDFEMVFFLDTGNPDRVGDEMVDFLKTNGRKKILMDHHVPYSHPSTHYDHYFLDENAAATAVIVYRFMESNKIPMDREIAECLYAAIMSDTGGMRYDNSDREAFSIMAGLVEYVEPGKISSQIWDNAPIEQLRFLSEVIGEMKILCGGRAAAILLTTEQYNRFGLKPDHTDGFINYARSVAGVRVAARFRQIGKNSYKVSLRSDGFIDAASVSNSFGGGGHRNAAGFVFNGTYEEGLTLIEEIVNREIS